MAAGCSRQLGLLLNHHPQLLLGWRLTRDLLGQGSLPGQVAGDCLLTFRATAVGAQLTVLAACGPVTFLAGVPGFPQAWSFFRRREHDGRSRADGHQHGRSGDNPRPAPPGRSDIWAGRRDILDDARRCHERLVDLRRHGVPDGEAAPLDARRRPGAPVDARRSPHRGRLRTPSRSDPGGLFATGTAALAQDGRPGQAAGRR